MQKNNCSNTKIFLKDFSSIEKITLPCSAPPIKEILDSCAKLSIANNKIIKTITGYNLIIKGHNLIKIRYLSCDCRGKVIIKKLISPFFITIPISPCFNIINVKANITYCDIDKCDNTVLFYNIISVCLSMSFTPAKSIIKCLNSVNCCDDLNFKNDSYPSKTNYCCNKKDNCRDDYTCFDKENCLEHNDCWTNQEYCHYNTYCKTPLYNENNFCTHKE